MSEFVFRADGTTIDSFAKAAEEVGIIQTSKNKPIGAYEYSRIQDTLSRHEKRLLRNEQIRIQPRESRTFRAGRDEINSIDFDLVENQTVRRSDPVHICRGPTADKTGHIVAELLQKQITVDIVKCGILYGVDSNKFFVSSRDLARIQRRDPRVVYDECVNLLVNGSVTAMRKPALVTKRQARTKPRQSVPIIMR